MKIIKITDNLKDTLRQDFEAFLKDLKTDSGKIQYSYTPNAGTKKQKATVYFTPMAFLKIRELVDSCDKEVGWYGKAERLDETTYCISDIVLYPQVVTAATVNTNDAEMGAWLNQLPDDIFNNMRFHGHSHVDMAVNPSGVDTTFYNDLLQKLSPTDFYIFSIFNKREQMHMEVYDMASNIHYEDKDINYDILDANKTELFTWVTENVEKYVKQPAKQTSNTIHYGYGGNQVYKGEAEGIDAYLDRMQQERAMNYCGNSNTVQINGRTYRVDNETQRIKEDKKNGSNKAK